MEVHRRRCRRGVRHAEALLRPSVQARRRQLNLLGHVVDGAWLWAAAALLYLVDTLHRVRGVEVVLRATGRTITASATRGSFGAFGTRFHLPLPLSGAALTFYPGSAHTGPATRSGAPTDDAKALHGLLRTLRPLRILGTLAFVDLFVLMPALAAWRLTLGQTLTVGLPLLYALNLAQAVFVVRRRGALLLASPWSLVSDILLCPPYGANLAGRLAKRWRAAGDAVELARILDPVGTLRDIVEPLGDEPLPADGATTSAKGSPDAD